MWFKQQEGTREISTILKFYIKLKTACGFPKNPRLSKVQTKNEKNI